MLRIVDTHLRSEIATKPPSSCSSTSASTSLTSSSIWSTILHLREAAGKEGADSQWRSIREDTEAESGAEIDTVAGRSGGIVRKII